MLRLAFTIALGSEPAHMAGMDEPNRYVVDPAGLPEAFPTHIHSPQFWEALGRAVATFGFLEETLGKAIFAFTATREYPPDQTAAAFERWLPTLQRALSDPLNSLITAYEKAVRDHGKSTIENLPDLISHLRKAATLRNVICHGSWNIPDEAGRSVPLFFNQKGEKFEEAIDVDYLERLQRHTVELICAVMNSVTHMGWQFPGSGGPGIPILGPRSPG